MDHILADILERILDVAEHIQDGKPAEVAHIQVRRRFRPTAGRSLGHWLLLVVPLSCLRLAQRRVKVSLSFCYLQIGNFAVRHSPDSSFAHSVPYFPSFRRLYRFGHFAISMSTPIMEQGLL